MLSYEIAIGKLKSDPQLFWKCFWGAFMSRQKMDTIYVLPPEHIEGLENEIVTTREGEVSD
jgi:hypothetical protein